MPNEMDMELSQLQPEAPTWSGGPAVQTQAQVRDKAEFFEGLIRSQIALSFKQRSSIELSEITTAESDEGPSSRSRTISPFSRVSFRRGEEAFNSLLAETSRLMSSHGELEHGIALDALSGKLADIAHALSRKEEEVENLQAVLKHLADTRSEAMRLKVMSQESYTKLQSDYSRVIKAAQLAQQTSRSHLSKLTLMRNKLRDTQDELYKEKAASATLRSLNMQLKQQNDMLLARVAALETSSQLTDCRQSLCQYVVKELAVMHGMQLY